MKKKVMLFGLLLVAVIALAACGTGGTGGGGTTGSTEKVCLVTDVGKVNDGTFNQFAYEGFTKAAQEFNLENKYIETQAQTDYENNINTCVQEGFTTIVTVGFLIGDATFKVAKENPNVYFIGIDQGYAEPLPNLVGVVFREDQSGFLAGALAAQMSKSGTVAGVYGIDVPAVKKFRNGFENGAKYINADINTLGVYLDSFVAPDKGASAAEQFIGEGADVIFGAGGPTGSGGIAAAAKKNVLVIGVDQDEYFTTFASGKNEGSANLISSAMKRVDVGTYDMIKARVTGTGWPEGSVDLLDAKGGGVGFAPAHDASVPDAVTAKLNEILAGLADGSIDTGVDPATGDLK
jgi:basic membrane lipoprotein Med (substrate-binding protein (PBP1-ABC) superfamily)